MNSELFLAVLALDAYNQGGRGTGAKLTDVGTRFVGAIAGASDFGADGVFAKTNDKFERQGSRQVRGTRALSAHGRSS
jgi:hypothetical protein